VSLNLKMDELDVTNEFRHKENRFKQRERLLNPSKSNHFDNNKLMSVSIESHVQRYDLDQSLPDPKSPYSGLTHTIREIVPQDLGK
jgi:hypothetical protein